MLAHSIPILPLSFHPASIVSNDPHCRCVPDLTMHDCVILSLKFVRIKNSNDVKCTSNMAACSELPEKVKGKVLRAPYKSLYLA
jgi:hypothetical protein